MNYQLSPTPVHWKTVVRNATFIILGLLLFLFALDLMKASIQSLGIPAAETIIKATTNPYTALFIGMIVAAILQSSSATTSTVIALVASSSLSASAAVPIIMGANVGTTITSTIVSLGFVMRKKEYRRAVSIGTAHDFFNVLTVMIMFPLEHYYGLLSSMSQTVATTLFPGAGGTTPTVYPVVGSVFHEVTRFMLSLFSNGYVPALMSIVLLYISILLFRRVLTRMLGLGSQETVKHFLFQNKRKALAWGLVVTALVRSSSVTTSLVVPVVARKLVRVRDAIAFIYGANIGTTITAFIAASFNSGLTVSIALAHFFFNLIGVIIFTAIPGVRELPLWLAEGLGSAVARYRVGGFLYLLLTFFLIPFALIYISKLIID